MSEIRPAISKAVPLTPDICVIGAGTAGLALATAAAAFGVPVVLVERGPMGRNRPDAGRMALLAAARQAQALRNASHFGISACEPQVNYAELHAHVQRAGAALASNDSAERLGALGVTVIAGEARFVSRSTVMAGTQAIKARRFVIATGSRPVVPSIAGLEATPFLTAESLLDLTRRPDRLLVLGGGSTGVALAQAMARLGSMVTIIEAAGLLQNEDPEASSLVRRALLRDGIILHEQASVEQVQAIRGGVRLVLKTSNGASTTLEGTHLLVTAGREPDIAALGLELAGVGSDADGITVNAGLRTANGRIFAIGDCASAAQGLRSGHVANHHAGLVLRSALFRLPIKTQAASIPRVTYSDPELASVGLSEAQLRARGETPTLLRWPFAENDRAQAGHETEGFLKLVADKKGRIIGVTIAGARADELIAPWCLAVQKGMAVKDMAGLVLPSASLSEVSTRAALSLYAPLAASPGLRRLIGFLRRFG